MPNEFDDLLEPLVPKAAPVTAGNEFDDLLAPLIPPAGSRAPSPNADIDVVNQLRPVEPFREPPSIRTTGMPERLPTFQTPSTKTMDDLLAPLTEDPRVAKRRELDLQMGAARSEGIKTDPTNKDFYSLGQEKTVPDLLPFIGQGKEIFDAGRLLLAAKRAKADPDNISPEDRDLLLKAHQERTSIAGETTGHAVGNILMQLPAFAVELAFTSPAYRAGKGIAQETVLKGAMKLVEDSAAKVAARAAVGKIGPNALSAGAARAAGTVAGSLVQAPLASGGKMVAGTLERMTPGVSLVDTPQGPKINIEDNADPFIKAAAKSFGNEFIEVFTEHTGEGFAKAIGAVANRVPGLVKLQAMKAALVARYLKGKPGVTVEEALKKLKTEAAWDGVIPEMLEERLGEFMRPALGVEDEYRPPTVQQLVAEGLAFMIPGAGATAFRAGSAVAQRRTSLRGESAEAVRQRAAEKTRKDLVDLIMSAAPTGGQDAKQNVTPTSVDESLFDSSGTPQGQGELPADVSGAGVPALGQGALVPGTQEAQAVRVFHGTRSNVDQPSGITFWSEDADVARTYSKQDRSVGGGLNVGQPRVIESTISPTKSLDLSWVTERTPWGDIRSALVDAGVDAEYLDDKFDGLVPESRPGIPGIFDSNWSPDASGVVDQLKAKGFDAVRVTEDRKPGWITWQNAQKVQPQSLAQREDPATAVAVADAQVNPAPTEAQKEAGNFTKGHVKLHGLDISIETPVGGERTGVGKDGIPWRVVQPNSYGYVKRSEGADGEHADVYIGPNPAATGVLVINQQDADTGKFDEQKAVLGYDSPEAAQADYEKGFSDGKGAQRVQSAHWVTVDEYKEWLKNGNSKKPFKPAKTQAAPAVQAPEDLQAQLAAEVPAAQPADTAQAAPAPVAPVAQAVAGAPARSTEEIAEENAIANAEAIGIAQTPDTTNPPISSGLSLKELQEAVGAALGTKKEPQGPISHNLLSAAVERAKPFLSRFRAGPVKLVDSFSEKSGLDLPAVAIAGRQAIEVHRGNLEAELAQFTTDEERSKYLDLLLAEEGIHSLIDYVVSEEDVRDVWKSLNDEQRTDVQRLYGAELKDSYLGGQEYLRMLFQHKVFGSVTEEAQPQTFGRLTEAIRNVLAKIIAAFKALGGSNNPQVDAAMARLEAAYQSPESFAALQPEAGGPRPAALITTPGQRHDELVSEATTPGSLPPSQVELVNLSGAIQNIALVGPVRNSFKALTKDVQAHLPFIQSRIAAMGDSVAHLSVTPLGDLKTMVDAAGTSPEERFLLMADAWENAVDLVIESKRLANRIVGVERELINLEKKGGRANNPAIALIANAWNDARNRLINQRTALIAQQANVSGLNDQIIQLGEEAGNPPTGAFRIVQALAKGLPIDFKALGIPSVGPRFLSILQAYPNLQAELAKVSAHTPTDPDVLELRKQIKDMEDGQKFVDALIKSSNFQLNYGQAVAEVGAGVDMVSESEARMTFDNFLSGNKVVVIMSANAGVNDKGQDDLLNLAGDLETFLAQPDIDPLQRSAATHQLDNIRNIYTSGAFRLQQEGSGKLSPARLDVFEWMKIGGRFATPESRLERIGGLAQNLALTRLNHYANAAQAIEARNKDLIHALNLLNDRAWKAHRDKKDGIKSLDQWKKEIANPIIASAQEMGSRRVEANSKYRGRVITKLDMEAAMKMKQYVDMLTQVARQMDTPAAAAFPLKIKISVPIGEGESFKYERDPLHRGALTMPRYRSAEAPTYVQSWLDIEKVKDEPKDSKRAKFMALLGGSNNVRIFYDLLVSHMEDAFTVPSYARLVGSEYKAYYATIVSAINDDPATGLRSVQAVIKDIFARQGQRLSPDKQQSEETIADNIFAEITTALKKAEESANSENVQGKPRPEIDIRSADNFLTVARGGQVLPSAMLDYTVTDVSNQGRALNAVNELLGQRYTEALLNIRNLLLTQKTEFEDRLKVLTQSGVKNPVKALRAESKTAQQRGENWYDYDELLHHLNQVQKAIAIMKGLADKTRSLDTEELRSATKVGRSIFSAVLQSPAVVMRNRIGGALRLAMTDLAVSTSGKVFGMSIPGLNLFNAPAKQVIALGRDILDIFPPLLSHQFFQTKKGQAIAHTLQANQGFWNGYAGWLYTRMWAQEQRYEKLKALGLYGATPFTDQMRAYWYLRSSGGRAISDNLGMGLKVLRYAETILGAGYQVGLPSLAPRGVFANLADLGANLASMKAVDTMVGHMEENALIYLGRRNSLTGVSNDILLTPQELIGNRFATDHGAAYTRLLWSKAGINVDQKMVDYFRRVEAAKAAGQPINDIRMLTETEANGLFQVWVQQHNKGTFANRPEILTTTEGGRVFGFLWGYPAGLNAAFSTALSRFSRHKGINTAGIATVGAWFYLIALAGLGAEPLARLLTMLIWNEERQTPKITQSESPQEAARILLTQAGAFMPTVGGLFNYVLESVKPGQGIGGSGINILFLDLINSAMDFVRTSAQTGDVIGPAITFSRKFFPNTKFITNRLPFADGSTEYYNSLRTLRANTPADIEYRRAGGGSYRKSSTSDNVSGVVNGLNRPTGVDWQMVERERALGIAELTSRGVEDPEGSFNAYVAAKTPLRAVYGRNLTPTERDRVLNRMSEDQRSRLGRVEEAFSSYRERFGVGAGRATSGTGGSRLDTGTAALLGGGSGVGLGRSIGSRGRSLGRIGRRRSLGGRRFRGSRSRGLRGRRRRTGLRNRSFTRSLRL